MPLTAGRYSILNGNSLKYSPFLTGEKPPFFALFWLCHTTKKVDGEEIVVNCHTKYHVANNSFVIGGTECTPVSDLTDEETDPPNNNKDSV